MSAIHPRHVHAVTFVAAAGAVAWGGACSGEDAPAADPCADVACAVWQECREGACQVAAGYCGTAEDCAADQICDADHRCAPVPDPCEGVDCSAHGTCVEDGEEPTCRCEAGYVGDTCVDCDDGYYQNGSSCVSRILFALPMANPDGSMIGSVVVGFDNDPDPGTSKTDCLSYEGNAFPFCYDQHRGTDFLLVGGFETMDAGSTTVLAAAGGVVIDAHDGEFDRCQLEGGPTSDVICPGYSYITPPNYVKLRHADGMETWYWHLKKDSVLVAVGDPVDCGDTLGLVGSSGHSGQPHLHFEVVSATGVAFDPYAGPYSQPESYWVDQEAEYGLPSAACQ